jgi:hypothetical protein
MGKLPIMGKVPINISLLSVHQWCSLPTLVKITTSTNEECREAKGNQLVAVISSVCSFNMPSFYSHKFTERQYKKRCKFWCIVV